MGLITESSVERIEERVVYDMIALSRIYDCRKSPDRSLRAFHTHIGAPGFSVRSGISDTHPRSCLSQTTAARPNPVGLSSFVIAPLHGVAAPAYHRRSFSPLAFAWSSGSYPAALIAAGRSPLP